MAYRKANNLEASGAVSQSLYNKITVHVPSASTGGKTYATLRPGMESALVRDLKDSLMALKFLNSLTSGSDVYDLDTVVAVKAFQTAYALKVDGIAGNETLNRLYQLAPPAP